MIPVELFNVRLTELLANISLDITSDNVLITLLSHAHAPDFKMADIATSPFIKQLNNIIYENENKQYSFCAR